MSEIIEGFEPSNKLLPCPFCGGKAHIEEHKFWDEKAKGFTVQTYGVVCDSCCSMSWQHHRHKEKAIEQWNTRKPMERICERLEVELKWTRAEQTIECERHNGYGSPLQSKNSGKIEALKKSIEICKEEGGIE